MKCGYCDQELEKRWKYCPSCGRSLRHQLNISDIVNEQLEHIKKMFGFSKYDKIFVEPNKSIMISISPGFISRPSISIKPTIPKKSLYEERETHVRKMPQTVIEPKTKIKRINNKILVSIELPDVKSENDIELSRLRNSTELRAHAGNKGYFKIVNIPSRYKLIDKQFKNQNLELRFAA